MTFREVGARNGTHGEIQGLPERRGVGRPSTVAEFAPQISEWFRVEPMLSGAEVLRRVRLVGYRGGKSALYELVRRLRLANSGNH